MNLILFSSFIYYYLITSVACKSGIAPLVILDFVVPAVYSFVSCLEKRKSARVSSKTMTTSRVFLKKK